MRLSIAHRTAYQYDAAVSFGIQYLRLTPYANASQRVIRWTIDAPGPLTRWTDAFGNLCDTLIFDSPGDRIEIAAGGEVETTDTTGVLPDEQGGVPVETYLRATPLTASDETVADFAAPMPGPYRETGSKGCTGLQRRSVTGSTIVKAPPMFAPALPRCCGTVPASARTTRMSSSRSAVRWVSPHAISAAISTWPTGIRRNPPAMRGPPRG